MLHNLSEEHLIRGYLLGELPESEQDLIEERVLADPEFLEKSEIVEAELIDDYALGLLSEEDRIRLESSFLRIPREYRRVQFTQMLGQLSLAGEIASQNGVWKRLLSEAHENRNLLSSLLSENWLGLRVLNCLHESPATRTELAAELQTDDDTLLRILALLTKSGLIEECEHKLTSSWFGIELLRKVKTLSESQPHD